MSAHRPHALTLVAGAAAIALGLAACGGGNTTAGTAPSAATTATATTAATPAAGPPPPRGRILYTDETTGRDQVWVVGSDGTGLHALRVMDGEQAHPGWAPTAAASSSRGTSSAAVASTSCGRTARA